MSDTQTVEAAETVAEDTQEQNAGQLPNDHPLVKTLAAQKAEIKDLKAKAKRLDDLEAAQMSEADKAAKRIADLEAENSAVPAKVADALRTHLVALHEIEPDDAELFLTATDPDLLLKQVTRLLGQSGKRKRRNHVAGEGDNPKGEPTSDMREFTRNLFGHSQ